MIKHRDGTGLRLQGDGLMLAADAFGPGSGQPVLFFHGGGQSRLSWRGAAKRMASAGYRCLIVDLRGHGESDWAKDGDYHLNAFARDVEALIDGLDRPAILVGASRGGQAALVGGARHPERVDLIMLADVAPTLRQEGVDEIRHFLDVSRGGFASVEDAADALAHHLNRERLIDSARLARIIRQGADGRFYWQWDPETARPEFIHPPSEEAALRQAASAVRSPIIMVRAELSSLVTDDGVALFHALAPHLEVVVAPGVGHMFTGDHNDAFASQLLERLQSPLVRREESQPEARRRD